MTGREYIAKRVGILGYLLLPLFFGSFAVLLFLLLSDDVLMLFLLSYFLIGILASLIVGVIISTRLVCPYCKRWIGPISRFNASLIIRGLPKTINYCPFCGVSFDTEMNDQS